MAAAPVSVPESIRLAVTVPGAARCVFSREARRTADGSEPSTLSPEDLTKVCVVDVGTGLSESALNWSTLALASPSDIVRGSPKTHFIVTTQFNHVITPNKVRYCVALVVQHSGSFETPGVRSAMGLWGAYSRSMRGTLARLVSIIAGVIDGCSGCAPETQRQLNSSNPLLTAFNSLAMCIWATAECGQDSLPMLASMGTVTSAAAFSALTSRVRALSYSRYSSTPTLKVPLADGNANNTNSTNSNNSNSRLNDGGERATPSSVPDPTPQRATPGGGGGPLLKTHILTSFETAAQNTSSSGERLEALRTLWNHSPELLAQIVTCCFGLSDADSFVSPFTLGVNDRPSAIHIDAVLEEAELTSCSESCAELPVSAADIHRDGTASRIVICTTDVTLGRAAMVLCAALFVPDQTASQLQRLLWNPSSVPNDDDDEAVDEPALSVFSSSPAAYPNFAVHTKTAEPCFNPVVWIEQSDISGDQEQALLMWGDYARMAVIRIPSLECCRRPASPQLHRMETNVSLVLARRTPGEEGVPRGTRIVPRSAHSQLPERMTFTRFPILSSVAVRHRLELLFGAPLPTRLLTQAASETVPRPVVDPSSAAHFQDALGSISVLRFMLPQRSRVLRATLKEFAEGQTSQQLCVSRVVRDVQARGGGVPWGSRSASFIGGSAPLANEILQAGGLRGDNALLERPASQRSNVASVQLWNASPEKVERHARTLSADAAAVPFASRPLDRTAEACRRICDAYSTGDALFASVILCDPSIHRQYCGLVAAGSCLMSQMR